MSQIYSLRKIVVLLVSLAMLVSQNVFAQETDAQNFLSKVKAHYQSAPSPKAHSLVYHYTRKHDWDYRSPQRDLSVRILEVDRNRKHFYDNDVLHLAGGRVLDRVQYQNDSESYFFDRNGGQLGKRVINQGLGNFDRFIQHHVMNLDFLAVRPLLDEKNISASISFSEDKSSGTSILRHKTGEGEVVEYVFSTHPIELKSIDNPGKQARFEYSDYQTTNGVTYAHSILKYYGGDTVPTFIHRNGPFNEIDRVDPAKLQLPEGFGPIIEHGDRTLTAQEMAENLYLVTDSTAVRNSVFEVDGDQIRLYGATGSKGYAEQTLALIAKHFPGKHIASVYITHPHQAQIAALDVFADSGIKVLADAYTIEATKANPRFANNLDRFHFETVEHGQQIGQANFYVLENSHSKRQSFAHFEQAGIIFQSHFMHTANDNTIPRVIPNYTKTFIDFIKDKELNVSRIVAEHNNHNISEEVMNKTYRALM